MCSLITRQYFLFILILISHLLMLFENVGSYCEELYIRLLNPETEQPPKKDIKNHFASAKEWFCCGTLSFYCSQ